MIYSLKNQNLEIKVNTLGAELISVVSNDYEYIHQPCDLWPGQAKNLFPAIGQTKDNYILVRGEKYPLRQHGFAKDMEFELCDQSEDCLSFVLKSNEATKEFLPYDFEFYIEFRLDGIDLKQTFRVVNLDDGDMYFGIGSHTGFIAEPGSYLDFGTNRILTEIKRKDMMYLTGECDRFEIQDGIIELEKDTYNHGADILTGFNKKAVTLKNHNHDKWVKVDFSEFSYLGMWTPANSQVAVSIMPWVGLPDAENTTHNFEQKQGNVGIKAGETYSVSQVISFGDK